MEKDKAALDAQETETERKLNDLKEKMNAFKKMQEQQHQQQQQQQQLQNQAVLEFEEEKRKFEQERNKFEEDKKSLDAKEAEIERKQNDLKAKTNEFNKMQEQRERQQQQQLPAAIHHNIKQRLPRQRNHYHCLLPVATQLSHQRQQVEPNPYVYNLYSASYYSVCAQGYTTHTYILHNTQHTQHTHAHRRGFRHMLLVTFITDNYIINYHRTRLLLQGKIAAPCSRSFRRF